MIFYIATDQVGKKHILTIATEAKAIDKNFQQVEILTDKASIKSLVQDSFDQIFNLEQQLKSLEHGASINHSPASTADPAPVAALPEQRQTAFDRMMEATEVEDFVLNRATVAQCENIFGCLGNRFAELAQKQRASSD